MPSSASADPPPSRLRAYARIAGLAGLFLLLLVPHLVEKALTGSSRWPRRFLAAAGWICGARARVEGGPPDPHSLLIVNHLSWLDILVMGGATGCAFVSKDEVRTTPLIGWLADQNRTLYVRRDERRAVREQAAALLTALDHPQPLALFPEGTTGNGKVLLPFRSTLFGAVVPLPHRVSVRPVFLDYGAAAAQIGWHGGEPGLANVLRVLGRRNPIEVVVRLLPPLAEHDDRKALATAARESIASALAASNRALDAL